MPVRSRWAWVVVLAVGTGLFLAVLRTLEATGNPNLLPALIVVGAAVVPSAFVVFVSSRRMSYDVPESVLAVTALLGGVIGVVIAGNLEFDASRRLGMGAIVLVGVIEEAAKLVVPVALLVLVRDRWRDPVNGLVLGVAAGAGFATLETMGYAFVQLVQSRGDLDAVVDILVLRGLLSPAAHLAWTGLAVSGLWWARWRGWRARSVVLGALGYLTSVVLHTVWDTRGSLAGDAVVAVISLVVLFVVAHRLGHHQRELRRAAPHSRAPDGRVSRRVVI